MGSGDRTAGPLVLAGIWQGVIQVGDLQLRIVFHVSQEQDVWTATLDSPDQGAQGIPVASVEIDGLNVNFDVPAVGGQYCGRIDPKEPKIAGEWHQGGRAIAVDLVKIEQVEKITRPQDPVPPFPYDEKEVTFVNKEDGIQLAGTLTLPREGAPFPAVILVSGSGAQNRNEEIMNHRPFLVLADHLTRRGIAVLRYDDRGVGGSSGDPVSSTSDDFARDAYAAFSYLSARADIDAGKTGIVGHSEGAIIATIIAARQPEVGFIVLLAGPGVLGGELLLQQSAAILEASGAGDEDITHAAELNRSIYEIIADEPDNEKASSKLKNLYTSLGIPDNRAQTEIGGLLTPWFRFFLSYNPADDLLDVVCPVLAVNGSLDLQVPADKNLKAIEEALEKGGNNRYKIVKLEGLNHLFQHATTGLVDEYAKIDETFAPEALRLVSDWIFEITR
jgi:fermentation-respiration switch protein FrsA (DUF1100 family)